MTLPRFRPKLVTALKGYSKQTFAADAAAGLTVGIVALPLAMAFAIASGATPQAGLVTAVIAGFIISAFGGTRVSIGGPTGAFVVILYTIGVNLGWSNLLVCTMMAGVILLVMGATGLGRIIKYIPYPVTMGFTSGIAVLIMLTQVKDFFGLPVEKVPGDFIEKLPVLAGALPDLSLAATVLSVLTFVLIRMWPKHLQRRVPGTIVAIIAATLIAWLLKLPVETIGSRFGALPQGLPPLQFPTVDWAHLGALVGPATTIALLAAIESLLCAVVADGMIDDHHDSDQELMAQGLANIVSPLFGGLAATSAIARTATNIRSGGRTPVAGIIHAITLLVILLVAAPLARFVPLAALSAVLLNVAIHMGEWHNFRRLRRWPGSDAIVFLTAFVLTVVIDLTVAVEVGIVLAALLFIKRVSETSDVALMEYTNGRPPHPGVAEMPQGIMVYRMMGALFFGAASKLETILHRMKEEPDVLILRLRSVVAMDTTGMNALENLYEKLNSHGGSLVLSAPQPQPLAVMEKAGFLDRMGRENVQPDFGTALERALAIQAARRATTPPV